MMKLDSTRNPGARADVGWVRLAGLTLALGFLALAPTLATGAESKRDVSATGGGSGSGTGDGVAGGDDETVGTLPIVLGSSTLTLHRHLDVLRPSMCLQGNVWDVMNSIVALRGEGDAAIWVLDPATGLAQVVIPGTLQIGIDRMSVMNGSVSIGLYIPDGSGMVSVGWAGRIHAVSAPSGVVSLPVRELAAVGALDQAPLQASAAGRPVGTSITAFGTQDVIVLRQVH